MLTLSPSGLLNKDLVDTNKYSEIDPTYISRYLLQAGILRAYQQHQGAKKKLKVLDVGGSGSILTQFVDVDLTIIDILPNKDKFSNYVQGSALAMPFADKSFDVVLSCDVLEHIPKNDREKFLKECVRVTKDLVIVAAPFNLKGVRDAEVVANDYYKKMTGEDHRWLFEHLLDELPSLQQAGLILGKNGLEYDHFSHTALNNWQLVTRTGFLLAHNGNRLEFVEHVKKINKYYLENIMSTDFSKTGYRTFIVASKKHEVDIKTEPDQYDSKTASLFTVLTDAIRTLL